MTVCVCVCKSALRENSGCIVMVRVVDYTISRGIPIISESLHTCGRNFSCVLEDGDTVGHIHNDIKGII